VHCVGFVPEAFVRVKINEHSAVIGGGGVMEGFIPYFFDGWAQLAAD
jgi:hypothetical protein